MPGSKGKDKPRGSLRRIQNFKFGPSLKQRSFVSRLTRREILDFVILGSCALLTALLVGLGGQTESAFATIFGLFLAGLGTCFFLWQELPSNQAPIERNMQNLRLCGMILLGVILARVVLRFGFSPYAIPIPMLTAIVTIVYGRRIALVYAWALCGAVSVASARWQGHSEPLFDISLFVSFGTACTALTFLCEEIQNRASLLRAGLISSLLIVLATFGARSLFEWQSYERVQRRYTQAVTDLQKLESSLNSTKTPAAQKVELEQAHPDAKNAVWAEYVEVLSNPFWAMINCLFSGFILYELLPWVERFFGVLTRLHLLELGDLNQPLLRRLNMEAPGTYHHSQMVATLSEAAAEKIGADALLVRVGAYYHDIGKMAKPSYFTENDTAAHKKHSLLSPYLSTLVIHAHVKDGIELARALGLPEQIIDFIAEHHGTSVVEYFYRQAVDQAEERKHRKPDRNLFRYPGPKPQTRESSIVMIADSVEAASRSMANPSPARIRNLVHEIIIDKLLDHQFSEAPINFAELQDIEDAIVNKLMWMYHARIRYPKKVEDKRNLKMKERFQVSSNTASDPQPEESVATSKTAETSEAEKTAEAKQATTSQVDRQAVTSGSEKSS